MFDSHFAGVKSHVVIGFVSLLLISIVKYSLSTNTYAQ